MNKPDFKGKIIVVTGAGQGSYDIKITSGGIAYLPACVITK